eukprot:TRINITY_DN1729_c0_g1_i4.p1 TRINITY_DN1729_c0_g1~~TRINITY_DN1729_c0_g1_i4.p1  ORF type:complete len:135 (-),score=5.73 TRINITY_DN1729_c0_g1_i4:17-421(-)
MNSDADNGWIQVNKLSPVVENIDQNLTLSVMKKSVLKRIVICYFDSETIKFIPICIKKYLNAYVFIDRYNNCYYIYINDKKNKKKKIENYLKKINKSKLIFKYQQPKQDDYNEYLESINANCFRNITNFKFKPL